MAGLERTVVPTIEPVTIAEAHDHIRLDDAEADTYVDRLIVAARERAESITDRAFVRQTWRYTLDRFPRGRRIITLPKPPLISVSSIAYTDAAGDAQTLTTHQVDTRSTPGRIRPGIDLDWPTVREQTLNAVTITYIAGYDDEGSPSHSTDYIPEPIKQAILMIAETMYDSRGNMVIGTIAKELPFAATNLLAPYVVYNFNF